eukprot:607888-Prymnesium_polylepis.1
MAVEVVRRVLAVASGVRPTRCTSAWQDGAAAPSRVTAGGDTAEIIGDERDDGVLLVLDRVGVVARLRRHPAEAGGV